MTFMLFAFQIIRANFCNNSHFFLEKHDSRTRDLELKLSELVQKLTVFFSTQILFLVPILSHFNPLHNMASNN